MKQWKRITGWAALLAVAVLLTFSLPAFAQEGSDDITEAPASQQLTNETHRKADDGSRQTGHRRAETIRQAGTEDQTEELKDPHAELHHKGDDLLKELRKQHKSQRSAAEVKQQCEARKQGLQTKFEHIVANSQRLQTKIDSILNKAQTFQQANNLQVADYDTLLASAQSAQAASAASINALAEVKPSLDCNNTSVAGDVATFKAAANTARDNLKAYRSAVKDLLKALAAAKPATDGSEQP